MAWQQVSNLINSVYVGGSSSCLKPVLSGVPHRVQFWGPILFIFYINLWHNECSATGWYVLCHFTHNILMTSCSTASYSLPVTHYHAAALQIDIDNLCHWTDRWPWIITCSHRGRSNKLPSSPITIKGASLECVSSYKFLGLWLTSTLSWAGHCRSQRCAKKARVQLGMLFRRIYAWPR